MFNFVTDYQRAPSSWCTIQELLVLKLFLYVAILGMLIFPVRGDFKHLTFNI